MIKKNTYDHKKIEKKWQKKWNDSSLYVQKTPLGKTKTPKSYVLDMFPYPSGDGLHVGHPKGYIATDIYTRYKKMNGHSILHTMGWDAFGLPAENYAIKNKIHPRKAVEKNIKRFKSQLEKIGFSYDWNREIDTTDPAYYKWTQWIFIKMWEKGLAYESFEPINWCPSCQTGLANEDLEKDGTCERCGSVVEKKPMRQWVLRITKYAERLLKDIDTLKEWPNSIRESQKNWIGKSEGAEISFDLKSKEGDFSEKVNIFTTRPDTLFGVTYIVLAPEHKLIEKALQFVKNEKEVRDFISKVKSKTEIERTAEGKEKNGIILEGIEATNPINGENVPVFIADYVLATYGTGAVMAVPAHDERDFAFAKKYNLGIKQVISKIFIDNKNPHREGKTDTERSIVHCVVKHPTEDKIIILKSKKFPWKTLIIGGIEGGEKPEEATRREVIEETGYTDIKSIEKIGWNLHTKFYAAHKDVKRNCDVNVMLVQLASLKNDSISESESQLHDVLWVETEKAFSELDPVCEKEEIKRFLGGEMSSFTGDGIMINSGEFSGKNNRDIFDEIIKKASGKKKTNYRLQDWVFSRQRYWGEPIPLIHCDKCGVVPVKEKDLPVTLPNVKSYEPTGTGESPLANISSWVNVKCPKCKGKAKRETNTMPQWAGSCWYYLRFMDPKNKTKLVDPKIEKYWKSVDMYVGGAEHATRHLIYARFWHKFLYDIGVVSTKEPFKALRNQGLILASDGRKMSKRYGNVINPDDIVEVYGADTMRIYEMFMGPFEGAISWSTESIIGSRRFIERVWSLQNKVSDSEKPSKELLHILHKTIKKVGEDIETFSMNTAISALMILQNEMEKNEKIPKQVFLDYVSLLSPFAPHMSDEIGSSFGNKKSFFLMDWPKYNKKYLVTDSVKIAVQVNGKLRDVVEMAVDSGEEEVKTKSLESENVAKWIAGKEIRKVIFIKNKLINIVL